MTTPTLPAVPQTGSGPSVLPGIRSDRFDLRPVYEPVAFLVLAGIAYLVLPPNLQYVLGVAVIYALLATSLGMLFGWAGTYTFGHAAFFGIGAYATALLKEQQWTPLLFLVASAVVAAVVALLVGLAGRRLVRVEFAMLTMIVGQIAYLLTFRVPVLEGDNGIYGIPRGVIFGVDLAPAPAFWWYSLVVVTVVLGVLRRISLSPFGEALNAIRDDPVKAAAIGIPVKAMRLAVFTLAGGVAGLAGALFAQQGGIVTPSTLTFTFSGQLIIMALLGGMKQFWGPAVGAIVFQFINAMVFGSSTNATLFLGVILLAVVLIFPNGILGLLRQARGLFTRATRRSR